MFARVTIVWLVLLVGSGCARNTSGAELAVEPQFAISSPEFGRSVGPLLGAPITDGNKIEILVNGAEIFPAMLEAIRKAEKTINFETFIYWKGEIGRKFTEALSERARAGVEVHLILDWFGSFNKVDHEYIETMRQNGVQAHYFNPLNPFSLSRINNRTHRKLLIIDGKIGFIGGVGIADVWDGNAESREHWRDTHFKLQGPAVAQMQAGFIDIWRQINRSILQGDAYFPPLPAAGEVQAHVFTSSPMHGSENAYLMYRMSIAAARESILIGSAYFVPDDQTIDAMVEAKKRGVRVEVIVPGHFIDVEAARVASRSKWGKLLDAGIEIYEYQPTMYHCKLMVVDGIWTSVGSANFSNRSFRRNDEANMSAIDRGVAKRLTEIFEMDKKKSRRITNAMWKQHPFRERFKEFFVRPVRSEF